MTERIPTPDPNDPVTITVPYWVACRIRTTMHREALEPEGCMCIEHYDESLTKPGEAFDIIKDQIDTWYQTWSAMTDEEPYSLRAFILQNQIGPEFTATGYASYHYWELVVHGLGVTQAAHGESHRDVILDYAQALGHDTDNAHILIHYPGQQAP